MVEPEERWINLISDVDEFELHTNGSNLNHGFKSIL